jgi:hypothetical protein
MYVVRLKRRGGKTSTLTDWVRMPSELPRTILVPDIRQVQFIRREHGLAFDQVHTFGQWMNTIHFGREPTELAIDNADQLLRNMLYGAKVSLISVTEEPDDGQ